MTESHRPRDAAEDWKRFDPNDIPTKGVHLPPIFDETLEHVRRDNQQKAIQVLELGCGRGDLSLRLLDVCKHPLSTTTLHHSPQDHRQEVIVVGTDINKGAIQVAKAKVALSRRAFFLVADVTAESLIEHVSHHTSISQFDLVNLQLLLSIVGTLEQRRSTLQNAWNLCHPGGILYISCSGISGDINPKYSELYEKDFAATGEKNTYFSRGNGGKGASNVITNNNEQQDDDALYTTHHFELQELSDL
jgi:SAM-dependent methyltransferase